MLESQYSDSLNFGLPYEGCTNRDTKGEIHKFVILIRCDF